MKDNPFLTALKFFLTPFISKSTYVPNIFLIKVHSLPLTTENYSIEFPLSTVCFEEHLALGQFPGTTIT